MNLPDGPKHLWQTLCLQTGSCIGALGQVYIWVVVEIMILFWAGAFQRVGGKVGGYQLGAILLKVFTPAVGRSIEHRDHYLGDSGDPSL